MSVCFQVAIQIPKKTAFRLTGRRKYLISQQPSFTNTHASRHPFVGDLGARKAREWPTESLLSTHSNHPNLLLCVCFRSLLSPTRRIPHLRSRYVSGPEIRSAQSLYSRDLLQARLSISQVPVFCLPLGLCRIIAWRLAKQVPSVYPKAYLASSRSPFPFNNVIILQSRTCNHKAIWVS